MRKVLSFIVLLLTVSVAGGAWARAPEGTPTRAIQNLDNKLDDYKTGPKLTAEDKAYNKEVKKDILHGTFDIKELARLALEKHWLTRTFGERKSFVELMTDLLENKAILSKEQGQKKAKTQRVYNIRYLGDKYLNSKKSRALAKTSVYVRSEDITVKLDYKLRRKDGEWMIYDVILDGASLVDNYKYQFDRIITKHDYAELVRRMEKKLAEIKAEDNESA